MTFSTPINDLAITSSPSSSYRLSGIRNGMPAQSCGCFPSLQTVRSSSCTSSKFLLPLLPLPLCLVVQPDLRCGVFLACRPVVEPTPLDEGHQSNSLPAIQMTSPTTIREPIGFSLKSISTTSHLPVSRIESSCASGLSSSLWFGSSPMQSSCRWYATLCFVCISCASYPHYLHYLLVGHS